MLPDQIRLEPILVDRPWGGRRLERLGRKLAPGVLIGESWELADLEGSGDEACTPVADGPLAGASISALLDRYGTELLGSAAPTDDGRFPLLVKLLDAREHLSVQVHPSIAAADVRPKTESWYVIDAEEDASVWFGVRSDVASDVFADAAGTPDVVGMLNRLPATAGEFHHIPAGRVHALGAGVMVLEVQTPSDTTFRIYDWTDEYERKSRELHIEAAMASITRDDPAAFSLGVADTASRDLVRSPHYWMREHVAQEGGVSLDDRPELRFVTVVAGEAVLGDQTLTVGDSRLLPARSNLFGRIETTEGAVVIETGLV
jgi:mannose-6-phosphate isomerase